MARIDAPETFRFTFGERKMPGGAEQDFNRYFFEPCLALASTFELSQELHLGPKYSEIGFRLWRTSKLLSFVESRCRTFLATNDGRVPENGKPLTDLIESLDLSPERAEVLSVRRGSIIIEVAITAFVATGVLASLIQVWRQIGYAKMERKVLEKFVSDGDKECLARAKELAKMSNQMKGIELIGPNTAKVFAAVAKRFGGGTEPENIASPAKHRLP